MTSQVDHVTLQVDHVTIQDPASRRQQLKFVSIVTSPCDVDCQGYHDNGPRASPGCFPGVIKGVILFPGGQPKIVGIGMVKIGKMTIQGEVCRPLKPPLPTPLQRMTLDV